MRNPRPTEQRKLILRFKLGSKKGTRNIFRFLERPAELRNYIYELLLTGKKGRLAIDVSDFFDFHYEWPESDLRNCRVAREYEYRSRIFRHPVYPLILAVNRQIHSEATPILYHNRISLDSFRDFNFFCRDIGNHRRHLRYIDVETGVDDCYFPFEHPDDLVNLRKVTLDILLYEQETGMDNAYNWFTGCVGGWMKAMLLKKGDIASVLEILHIENCRVCDIEGMEDSRELETEKIAEFEKDFKGELADLLVKFEEDEEEEDEEAEEEEEEIA